MHSASPWAFVQCLGIRGFRYQLPHSVHRHILKIGWQLDNDFVRYHHIRARRIRDLGDRVVRTLGKTTGLVSGGRDSGKLSRLL
jgi:hypothetical protein